MGLVTTVLFLDVDGVLVPMRAYVYAKPRKGVDGGVFRKFDPVAVATILDILERSDAKIVLSSSRGRVDPARALADFAANGVGREWFHEDAITPRWPDHADRGIEIRAWLEKHPEVTTYAVLDDDHVDIDCLVQVKGTDGLLYEHADQLEELLDARDRGQSIA